jgi:hypothetical protein
MQKSSAITPPEAGVATSSTIAPSTGRNSYINFALGGQNLPLTNGTQIASGSSNPVPMGSIPSSANIPSSKFVFPPNGDSQIDASKPFSIQFKSRGPEEKATASTTSTTPGANFNPVKQEFGTSKSFVEKHLGVRPKDPQEANNSISSKAAKTPPHNFTSRTLATKSVAEKDTPKTDLTKSGIPDFSKVSIPIFAGGNVKPKPHSDEMPLRATTILHETIHTPLVSHLSTNEQAST